MLPRGRRAHKKQVVAARLESYHRGYLLGLHRGSQNSTSKRESLKKKVRKVRSNTTCKKLAVVARLDAYQKGYQLGTCRGAQQERARQAKDHTSEKSRKARSGTANKVSGKRLTAVRLEAYLHGVDCGARQERIKQAKVSNSGSKSKCAPHGVQAGKLKTVKSTSSRTPHSTSAAKRPSDVLQASSRNRVIPSSTSAPSVSGPMPTRGAADVSHSKVQTKVANPSLLTGACAPSSRGHRSEADPQPMKLPPKTKQTPSTVILASATPMRAACRAEASSSPALKGPVSTTNKRATLQSRDERNAELRAKKQAVSGAGAPSQTSATLARSSMRSAGINTLRSFLEDPVGVTSEPAAFQLRCKQVRAHGEHKVVFVVGGKCKLWKLNQIIAECFDAAEKEFACEPKKGATVLGSRFIVSRPLQPGQCNSVAICSCRSDSHEGSASAFVDDRSCNVAQLFRGKSTGHALQRERAEQLQQVIFASPLLSEEVVVSLDGIMLDGYDSHNLFDKSRRYSNGRKPLPRIVCSSFLSVADIEAKNFVMQGAQQGPGFLAQFDTSWSAIHASYRRSQRKPLFRKDGRDFDVHPDLCHFRDEETDTDADDS